MASMKFFNLTRIIVLTLLIGSLGGCSTNPATGHAQLNMMSESEEVKLGSESAPRFVKEMGGEIPDARIRQYVSKIGGQLAAVSERPQLPWEFHVVDSAMLNAFALPGGKVFVSRGLMVRLTNEAQLAGVLGHEVGHVTAQHIGQQMTQASLLSIGLQVATNVSGNQWTGVIGGYGGKLYLLRFGRGQESQSDTLALRYMTAIGYDPNGMLGVLKVLKAASGDSGGLEMLRTHPLPQTRIDDTVDKIKSGYAQQSGNSKFRLGADTYKSTVLDRLKQLPPPRHRP